MKREDINNIYSLFLEFKSKYSEYLGHDCSETYKEILKSRYLVAENLMFDYMKNLALEGARD